MKTINGKKSDLKVVFEGIAGLMAFGSIILLVAMLTVIPWCIGTAVMWGGLLGIDL